MTRTRIKICGITRPEDAAFAASAGADAVGLVFVPASPRCVSTAQAQEIVRAVPALVHTVALFADADESIVTSVIATVQPSLLQFHGAESAERCAQSGKPFIRALRVTDTMQPNDLLKFIAVYETSTQCRAVLLDAPATLAYQGHGATFDWQKVPAAVRLRLIFAGGLTPQNVSALVRTMRPYAVDVSSGVESAPGVKDHRRIEKFIEAVRLADEDSQE